MPSRLIAEACGIMLGHRVVQRRHQRMCYNQTISLVLSVVSGGVS